MLYHVAGLCYIRGVNTSTFSELIRTERRRLGLTQQAMADAGRVSKRSQVSYESGARVPDIRYVRNVCQVGADALFLVTGSRDFPSDPQKFSWEAHDEILEAIEVWLRNRKASLPFPRKMELLRLFIAHFEIVQHVDVKFIDDTLSQAA